MISESVLDFVVLNDVFLPSILCGVCYDVIMPQCFYLPNAPSDGYAGQPVVVAVSFSVPAPSSAISMTSLTAPRAPAASLSIRFYVPRASTPKAER